MLGPSFSCRNSCECSVYCCAIPLGCQVKWCIRTKFIRVCSLDVNVLSEVCLRGERRHGAILTRYVYTYTWSRPASHCACVHVYVLCMHTCMYVGSICLFVILFNVATATSCIQCPIYSMLHTVSYIYIVCCIQCPIYIVCCIQCPIYIVCCIQCPIYSMLHTVSYI